LLPQVAALDGDVQPHTLGVPPPPQVAPWAVHCVIPQFTIRPQLSATMPHLPIQTLAVESGVQPQTLGVPPPPQVTPVPEQVPQVTWLPQLSATMPHLPLQVTDMESGVQPQTLGVPPPPQVTPVPIHCDVPQSIGRPLQPSMTVPHLPAHAAVGFGMHSQMLFVQVAPGPQVWPQSTGCPQLSTIPPHLLPAQALAGVPGVQPHSLAVPPPPQVTPVPMHWLVPQSTD
jgi:hypothetical protein